MHEFPKMDYVLFFWCGRPDPFNLLLVNECSGFQVQ